MSPLFASSNATEKMSDRVFSAALYIYGPVYFAKMSFVSSSAISYIIFLSFIVSDRLEMEGLNIVAGSCSVVGLSGGP